LGGDAPVAGVPITFYVVTTVFGERLMKVGESLSDATGMSSVLYRPTWDGDHTAVARFAGTEDYAPTQASFHFDVLEAESLYEPADFGLNPVRQWLPAAVGLFVLAVWGSMIFALLSTVRGIRAAGAGVAAVPPIAQPWQRPVQHPAPLGRILVALAVLLVAVVLPASWLLGQTGGPSDETLSTPDAHFEHDGTDGGQFDPSQPITLPDPVPLTATFVSFVETVTFDAGGQPEPGSVAMPSDVVVNAGRVRILDGGRGRIATVTGDGKLVFILETSDTDAISLKGAQAMVALGDQLFIPTLPHAVGDEAEDAQVVIINASGNIENAIHPVIPEGQAAISPAGIAISESGEIWISDAANHRVISLNERGEFQRIIGDGAPSANPEGFNTPGGITIDKDGNLYVADSLNRVVKKFSPNGVLLQTIGAGRLDLPTGVAVNEQGLIFVSDEAARQVSAFVPNGGYLGSISDERFAAPHSLKTDGDLLYVVDRLAGLFVFRPLDTDTSGP
jgi:DNA-binding beta-propeller fold protein YncE